MTPNNNGFYGDNNKETEFSCFNIFLNSQATGTMGSTYMVNGKVSSRAFLLTNK